MGFSKKWNMYMNALQGHASVAHTNKSADLLRKYVEPYLPKGKCLAIGCADGMEVKALNDLGYNTIGITLSQINIDWAKRNLPNIDIRVMEFHDLKFPNESFDCAYSDNSYEHTFAPMIHCLEVWSVLKIGGKWLIKMPSITEDVYAGNQLDHHHPNMYPQKYHKKVFDVCGFNCAVVNLKRGQKNNDWLLTKRVTGIHSTIATALNKRKEIFG